jgi:oxygen-independent coproporphyrinogen III oxidase
MAGIYIHIPFCRKVCYYCDFHFTVSFKRKNELLNCIIQELKQRTTYLSGEDIKTIYIGGGTPSVLSLHELETVFNTLYSQYNILQDAEITLEANPDDLSGDYLDDLRKYTPVNRLSIGIQSFNNNDLKILNRRHTGEEAYKSVEKAILAGYENITVDLMYGIPSSSLKIWNDNIEKALQLQVPHISAYHLSIEPKTVFAHFQKKGKIKPVDEEISNLLFNTLVEYLGNAGYLHYEISNFGKPGYISRHNSNYWLGDKYLGAGPSAHSYDHHSRQWNTLNHVKYIRSITNGTNEYFEKEILDQTSRYNDIIITRLRTSWGIDRNQLEKTFSQEYIRHFNACLNKFLKSGDVVIENDSVILSEKGMLRSDYIFSDFVYTDES